MRLKATVIILCVCMSFAGCAKVEDDVESIGESVESLIDEAEDEYNISTDDDNDEGRVDDDDDSDSDFDDDGVDMDDDGLVGSAVDVLKNIWDRYTDDDRFSATGGDDANSVTDAPGTFDIQDVGGLSTRLVFPSDNTYMIDDAASLMNSSDSNTFTGGVYHVSDTENVSALAYALKDNIESTEWAYGSPDRLIIVDLGDGYVLCAFGEEETLKTFKERMSEAYSESKILYDQEL